MNAIPLLLRDGEVGPIVTRALRVCVSDTATCIIARQGLVPEGQLTSVEDETLHMDLYAGGYRTAWLTRDNPFHTEGQLRDLDEQGVVRAGTTLEAGDMLASILESALYKA